MTPLDSSLRRHGLGTPAVSRRALLVGAAIGAFSRPARSVANDRSAQHPAAHVTAITFSPDGKQLVTGSSGGVAIRNANTQVIERTIAVDLDSLHDLRFAPDGQSVAVAGGDTYAQILIDSLVVPFDDSYHAGHITVEGKLYDGTTVVADGAEQVLLQNRPSWNKDIASYTIAVSDWAAAKTAIQDAGVSAVDFSASCCGNARIKENASGKQKQVIAQRFFAL